MAKKDDERNREERAEVEAPAFGDFSSCVLEKAGESLLLLKVVDVAMIEVAHDGVVIAGIGTGRTPEKIRSHGIGCTVDLVSEAERAACDCLVVASRREGGGHKEKHH